MLVVISPMRNVISVSVLDYLREQLDVYMSQFPKVRIIRLKERQGLIRARMAGAAAATGTVHLHSIQFSLEAKLQSMDLCLI